MALMMIFSFCACGDTKTPSDSAEVLDNGRYSRVTVALSADPENLEPKDGNNLSKIGWYWQIYETLFDYDDNGQMVPSLGKTITCVDELTYDVEIYDCIYDSEGNHITAEDVVYSVNWLVDNGNAVKYDLFESIEAVGDYTIRWHWNAAPTSWGDLEFPLCRTFIFSQAAFESRNFSSSPVGTGSYVVKSYTSGSSLVLEANDDYWLLKNPKIMDTHLDLHRANVQTIEYKIIAEAAQAQIALEQGTVDYCDYVLAQVLSEFQSEKYAGIYKTNSSVAVDYYYLSPNCFPGGVMDDINLRLAIWYALDSASIATVMGGQYVPMDTFGNEAYPDYNAAWADEATYMNTQNLDRAKEYLANSSYSGEELVLVGDSTEACKNALTMIQSQLQQVGIKTKIDTMSASMFQTTTASPNGWDIHFASVGGTSLVGSYNRLFGNGVNTYEGEKYSIGFVKDDKLQTLYEESKADATNDDAHIKAVIDYAMEKGYMYALAGTSTTVVYSADIDLYYREGFYATMGCSNYDGVEEAHSQNVTVLEVAMPEPTKLAENVYIFKQIFNPEDGMGITYTLTLGEDGNGWTLDAVAGWGDEYHLSGDKYFDNPDVTGCIMTTPPASGEYPQQAEFVEDDGLCKWVLFGKNAMVPLNYADADAYMESVLSQVTVFEYAQIFNPEDGAGIYYTLTLGADGNGWTLDAVASWGDEYHLSGDKYFDNPEVKNCVMTTPPASGEYPKQAEFVEDDGLCKWVLDRSTASMIPLNLIED